MVVITGPGLPPRILSDIKETTPITLGGGTQLVVLADRILLGVRGAGAGFGFSVERLDPGSTWRILEDSAGNDLTLNTSEKYTLFPYGISSDGTKIRLSNFGGVDLTAFSYLYLEQEPV